MTELSKKILNLRRQGKSYRQIVDILGCSKGTVCYHLGDGQKTKTRKRSINFRKTNPYAQKLDNFLQTKKNQVKRRSPLHGWEKLIILKIQLFCRRGNMESDKITLKDVTEKFGDKPRCYITGEQIDIYKPRTYNFDHIIPVSRGGTNTLDNLGICTKKANQSKSDMTPDEFFSFCQQVIDYQNSIK